MIANHFGDASEWQTRALPPHSTPYAIVTPLVSIDDVA
jgi:hypothetical protein